MATVPRSNRPRRAGRPRGRTEGGPAASQRPTGVGRVEEFAGEEFAVRQVTGAAATKAYRCPGCDHEIPPGTPHVVAWPLETLDRSAAAEGRRHWHTPCWDARGRRCPRRP